MSDCPSCRHKGQHVALIVPRDPKAASTIVHRCQQTDCLVTHWEEKAKESVATILRSFERNLEAKP